METDETNYYEMAQYKLAELPKEKLLEIIEEMKKIKQAYVVQYNMEMTKEQMLEQIEKLHNIVYHEAKPLYKVESLNSQIESLKRQIQDLETYKEKCDKIDNIIHGIDDDDWSEDNDY